MHLHYNLPDRKKNWDFIIPSCFVTNFSNIDNFLFTSEGKEKNSALNISWWKLYIRLFKINQNIINTCTTSSRIMQNKISFPLREKRGRKSTWNPLFHFWLNAKIKKNKYSKLFKPNNIQIGRSADLAPKWKCWIYFFVIKRYHDTLWLLL